MEKLFLNARIHTPIDKGKPLSGSDQGKLSVYEDGAMLVSDGIIKAVGQREEIQGITGEKKLDLEIDCAGQLVIPGFVDPHTHLCFAARRDDEFGMRLEGASYMDIHRKRGVILSSVRSVRTSSEEQLYSMTLKNALLALSHGTTTVEIKSGYGLDIDSELKMLRVIKMISRTTPLDVIPTFMGAHAVPEEYKGNTEGFVDMIVEEMLPAVAEQGIARFADVFCEKGVFSADQSRKIMEAAGRLGLGLKIHADEVEDTGGAKLAAQTGSVSAEHLLAASDANIDLMAQAGVIATLLPATAYSLKKRFARARFMIEKNVPVALATDCNPGSSYTESMPFVFSLAVMMMNMTPSEALVASTLNSAYAINAEDRAGSLQEGKKADFLVLDGQNPAIFAYHGGVSSVKAVYKCGELVSGGML